LAAVELGWKQGVNAVEVDVRLCRDGRPVLLHDENLRRTTGVDAKVSETAWQELARLDAGAWKGRQWVGESIPALEEVIALLRPGRRLWLDLKCGPQGVDPIRKRLEAGGVRGGAVILMSEHWSTVRAAKLALSRHSVFWIVNLRRHPERGNGTKLAEALVQQAAEERLDGLGLRCCETLTAAFAGIVKEAGQQLYVWTVDEVEAARAMQRSGTDWLATNRPAWLRGRLGL